LFFKQGLCAPYYLDQKNKIGHGWLITKEDKMITTTICRHCGQKVYFYQNSFGSKVFFDELGGEWSKHDCKSHSKHHMVERFKPRVILIKKEA
jgi:hypothetical protein